MDVLIPGLFYATQQAYEIAFITLFITAISALVRRATVDFEKVKETREKIKEHQKAMKEAQKKGQTEKMLKAQEEMSKHMMENMQMTFRPLLITFIPFILIFGYLNTTYSDLHPAVNVTIIDTLPAKVAYDNVKPSDGGRYNEENKTITWFKPLARADNEYTLTVDAKASRASREELESNTAQLTYFYPNGTKGPIVSNRQETPEGSIMSLSKTMEEQANGNIRYVITYRNTATNNVVFFPYYGDLWIIHIHGGFDWFMWYFVFSIFCSIIINKLIGAT